MYTVIAPKQLWLGESIVDTLGEAIQRKAAWMVNQPARPIILDADGYIVSTHEQNKCIAGYTL